MMADYYKILGVSETADEKEIKKAYRALAMKYHPDTNKESGSDDKFKEINEAYSTLSDPDKKSRYDLGRNLGSSSSWPDFNDIFSAHYNPFNNTKQNPPQRKGISLNITLQMNLNDILNGVEKKIKIKVQKRCNTCSGSGGTYQNCGTCHGTGFISVNQQRGFVSLNSVRPCIICGGTGKAILESCLDCRGKGFTEGEEIIDIKIPAGASDGMQFVMENKGNESTDPNGKKGDLYVKVKEIPDAKFIRRGIDLISTVQITFIQAIQGANIDVQLPNGETVKAVIDPGTVPGTILKFSQKGVPNLGYGGVGNFLLETTIKIPKPVDEKDHKLLERLKKNKLFK